MVSIASQAESVPKKRRRPTNPSRYLYVRRPGRGFLWQARAWLPSPIGSIHLGLYEDEWLAHRAVQKWLRETNGDPLRPPPGVPPKWTRELGDGRHLGQVRLAGVLHVAGPFDTAEEAHAVVRDEFVTPHLARLRVEELAGRKADRERCKRERKERRRARVAELLSAGVPIEGIAAELGVSVGVAKCIRA